MGLVKVPEILRFLNDDGFLFSHVWGKTLRDGDDNVFGRWGQTGHKSHRLEILILQLPKCLLGYLKAVYWNLYCF